MSAAPAASAANAANVSSARERLDFTDEEIRRLAPQRPGVYYSELVLSRTCVGRYEGRSRSRKWDGTTGRTRLEAREEILEWMVACDTEKHPEDYR